MYIAQNMAVNNNELKPICCFRSNVSLFLKKEVSRMTGIELKNTATQGNTEKEPAIDISMATVNPIMKNLVVFDCRIKSTSLLNMFKVKYLYKNKDFIRVLIEIDKKD
jgi:hypothetical protein